MDRRLPPSFRKQTDPSPHRDRTTTTATIATSEATATGAATVGTINRSYNRPWGSGPGNSSSSSSNHTNTNNNSSIRSSFTAAAPAVPPSPSRGSSFRASTPDPPRSSPPRPQQQQPLPPNASSSYGFNLNHATTTTTATTTTIAGTKAVSGFGGVGISSSSSSSGLSSYERYQSLRSSQHNSKANTTPSSSNASFSVLSSSSSAAAAAATVSTTTNTTTKLTAPSPNRNRQSESPGPSASANYASRSSSPRDLRMQRLQQQYSLGITTTAQQQQQQQPQYVEPSLRQESPSPRQQQQQQQQHQDVNELFLDRVRRSAAASSERAPSTARDSSVLKDQKKLKKHRKQSSASSSSCGDPDGAYTMTKKSTGKQEVDECADSDDADKKKKKKTKKPSSSKSTSRSSRKSSSSTGSVATQEDTSGDDLDNDYNNTMADDTDNKTNVSRAEPSIQAALLKLGRAPPAEIRTTTAKSTPPSSANTTPSSRLAALQQQSSLESTQRLPPSSSLMTTTSGQKPLSYTPMSSLQQEQQQQQKDEQTTPMSSATRGWSTYRSRTGTTTPTRVAAGERNTNPRANNPFMSKSMVDHKGSLSAGLGGNLAGGLGGVSKVSQYLSQRKSTIEVKQPTASLLFATDREKSQGQKPESVASSDLATITTTLSESVFGLSETTDDDEEEIDDSSSSSEEEYEANTDTHSEWSARVCVVSAVDLPPSVVPTVPFSPVIKVGLVSLKSTRISGHHPGKNKVNNGKTSDQLDQEHLKQSIHVSGLMSVPHARIRCTNTKVMSKRENGSVEFHEEMRWDAIQRPDQMAFAIELSARAVMVPSNHKESPLEQIAKPEIPNRDATSVASGSDGSRGRINALFRRGDKKHPSSEMDMALAASAVAKHLVEGEEGDGDETTGAAHDSRFAPVRSSMISTATAQSTSEIDVKLIQKPRKRKPRLTEDIRLGAQIIPLSKLAWQNALKNKEAVRIEQWFELETALGGSLAAGAKFGPKSSRNPSVLLEISFSSPEVLDDSEDDIEEVDEKRSRDSLRRNASFARRASITIRSQLIKEVQMEEVKQKEEEPVLHPGVIDYVCIVGAKNIGDQKKDTGASGWVHSSPESGILEQFPPASEYHAANGRNVSLPDKLDWFCFPEGVRLWRGTTPPNSDELNLVRFSASSPANIAATIASFDACLGCTTSFSWFVLSSNSDEYGSTNTKMYGACIRFFVPAPTGIDPTQDDFGQAIRGAALNDKASKRLWVPMALCLTTQLPIVGAMEVMLLRMCEALSSMVSSHVEVPGLHRFFSNIASLVFNFQRPIPGVVSCSIPFLRGDPLIMTLPPLTGLPQLPHGASVTSACRLLGANGINYLLAAMLTECKILLHSDDIANLCLVSEVMSALIYPFQWSLPYIPVLPMPMMEFIEAPLSYLLGVPSSSMKLLRPDVLDDVVVIDLDTDFSGAAGLVDDVGRTKNPHYKVPTPLPASTASNIQKAVYRLLQHHDDNDDDSNGGMSSSRSFPRTEPETQVEREFRIAVALEIAGLVRGYNDCLVIGPSNQPVFNVEKFLQSAPILFDEQRGTSMASPTGLRVLSPRSRRFISILVTCQHFHQFLEVSESESLAFFREVMVELEAYGSKRDPLAVKRVLSLDAQKTIDQLNSILKRVEDKVPLYKVQLPESDPKMISAHSLDASRVATADFPYSLLRPIVIAGQNGPQSGRAQGVNQISLEHLVELEKNPWRYQTLLNIDLGGKNASGFVSFVAVADKVKLRDAIGERRYHLWKNSIERGVDEDTSMTSEDPATMQALDWGELLAEHGDESANSESGLMEDNPGSAAKRRIADAKDRDLLRRCLEQARVAGGSVAADTHRDLVAEAEGTLRNKSARKFLLSILKKRGSNEPEDSHRNRRRSSGGSKLESGAFEALLRLGCAMLDACIEDRDYDSAYALLKLTAGLYSTVENRESSTMLYMTQRLGHHPIFADLGVWLRAKKIHLNAGAENEDLVPSSDGETDEYEAAVATLYEMLGYGIPAEELARFASRVSEENGWFRSERGQSLLLLARRICMRRDAGPVNSSQRTTSDIEMMSPAPTSIGREGETSRGGCDPGSNRLTAAPTTSSSVRKDAVAVWTEIGWVHPSAQYSSRFEKDVKRRPPSGKVDRVRHMKRSAVTSMSYLGSSVVVTGAMDGGVFMARKARSSGENDDGTGIGVKGIHLDWGSAGSRYTVQSSSTASDGAYGVGAVSILAATQPANQSYDALQMKPGPSRKSVIDSLAEEELINAMEGCRVVAGTTCGDLRVWSVKDVLSAVFYAMRGCGNDLAGAGGGDDRIIHRGGEGVSSSVIGTRRRAGMDFAAGSSLTRLKFSLRGRALSGHRGGVSCVDVPSHVYRPDSIITGGADGLIKLWSLRTPGSGARRPESEPSPMAADQLSPRAQAARSGDAMSILSGHGGRVLCVKTAWHGDRLLSGGADRTVRLWDVGGSGGKCLNSLSGHFGWVTSVKYWGPNTIISASTDRSIALWDARVRNAPLFTLRHHYAPISDILVGARTDPIMISAGGDGTIAAWDFRRLSDASSQSPSTQDRQCKVIRRPAAKLYLHDFSSRRRTYGPVLLSRGPNLRSKTVSCVGRDAIIREWDIRSGEVVSEHITGHCDTISTFTSLDGDKLHDPQHETAENHAVTGTITTSWDGTVRVRQFDKEGSVSCRGQDP